MSRSTRLGFLLIALALLNGPEAERDHDVIGMSLNFVTALSGMFLLMRNRDG